MRTPLNGMLGMLQLANASADPAEVKDLISHAISAGTVLKQLLDDTLDVTRLEQGRAHMELGRVSLPEITKECVQMVRSLARAKDIDLQLSIDEGAEAAADCLADSRRLKQVCLNLLTNAIKFTPNLGVVELNLTLEQPQLPRSTASADASDGEGDGRERDVLGVATLPFLLTVRDTGIGIHADDIELVFLKYTKATNTGREHGVDGHAGAGLGLSICKAIVEQHHGSIAVESVPGKGSTFSMRLELPLAAPHAASGGENGSEDRPVGAWDSMVDASVCEVLSGCRILVADDVKMNRSVLCSMLTKLGCKTAEVNDGAAAVELVKQQRELHTPFDAVLMDVQMPVMSGLEATMRIRALEKREGAAGARSSSVEGCPTGDPRHCAARSDYMPIIAVTGLVGSGERSSCVRIMDDYMTKPIDLGELASKLAFHLSKRRAVATLSPPLPASAAAAPPPPPPSLPAKLRVLIADDNATNVLMMKKTLLKLAKEIATESAVSWRLSTASAAEAAVRDFQAALDEDDRYGLVIMDEEFGPQSAIGGRDAIQRMRALEGTASCTTASGHRGHATAFVLWTGHHVEGCSEICDADGVDDVWGKPPPSWVDGSMQARIQRLLATGP